MEIRSARCTSHITARMSAPKCPVYELRCCYSILLTDIRLVFKPSAVAPADDLTPNHLIGLPKAMDRSLYKSITTKRGPKYVYASIPAEGAPRDTLLFVHGFPSSSHDWRYQVDFFRKAGFSLIIPDLLGAGETDKPTDSTFFQLKAMAGDIIDILDAEKAGKVILIGHDWFVSLTA